MLGKHMLVMYSPNPTKNNYMKRLGKLKPFICVFKKNIYVKAWIKECLKKNKNKKGRGREMYSNLTNNWERNLLFFL